MCESLWILQLQGSLFSCCCSNLTSQMGSFCELSYSVCLRKREFSKEEALFVKKTKKKQKQIQRQVIGCSLTVPEAAQHCLETGLEDVYFGLLGDI